MSERARSPLRVLVHCGGSYVSGTEIVELSVMRGLQKRGHTVHCITNAWNDGEFHRRLEEANISYRSISLGAISASLKPKHLWWTLNALIHLPKAYLDFWRELRRFGPDVILFSGARSLSTILPLVDLRKTILHVHEVPGKSKHFQRVKNANAQGGCRAYIAVSKFIGGCLEAQGAPQNRIHVVHNGVPLDPTVNLEATAEAPTITIAGQVGPWKGHDDLVEALRQLAERTSAAWRCQIVGTGDDAYIEHLQEKIRHAGLAERIVWRGFQGDMDEVYRETDILVAPSRHEEPFGLVAAEAGAHGLPVIVARHGGLPEIVDHERTGFLVDAEAPEQIAERLEQLIRSPGLRKRMGRAARRRVQSTFSRMQMIDGVEGVLASVANNHVGPKA